MDVDEASKHGMDAARARCGAVLAFRVFEAGNEDMWECGVVQYVRIVSVRTKDIECCGQNIS